MFYLSNYPPHKARTINLVIGIILVILSIGALISFAMNSASGLNVGLLVFIFILVFMGGYEIGKYAENHLSKQWARLNK